MPGDRGGPDDRAGRPTRGWTPRSGSARDAGAGEVVVLRLSGPLAEPRQQRGDAVPAAGYAGGGLVARRRSGGSGTGSVGHSWRFAGSPMPPTAATRWRAIKSRLQGYTAGRHRSGVEPDHLLACAADLGAGPGAVRTDHGRRWCPACKTEPALDILAGWLASRIDGPVQRAVGDLKVELVRASETITLSRPQEGVTATLSSHRHAGGTDSVGAQGNPGMPGRGPAQARRRRDLFEALKGIDKVQYV